MRPAQDSQSIEIESFEPKRRAGVVELRPVAGQPYSSDLRVEGKKSLSADYPVGTRFKAQVALTDKPAGAGQFLYSSWQWDVQVLSRPDMED